MVTGNHPPGIGKEGTVRYYRKGSGKPISEEKARKMDAKKLEKKYTRKLGGYSILHYINKDMPLDEEAKPNFTDPMMKLWDESLNGKYEQHK